jgi:uncharacterized membrane protein YvbJ
MQTIFCHSCGTKILESSTFCPGCGAKQQFEVIEGKSTSDSKINSGDSAKKPFYLKTWFIIFAIIVLIGIFKNLTKEKEVWNGRQFVPQSEFNKEFGK